MHKTTLVVDDELLREAAEILGTKGVKETVDAALNQVVVQYARQHLSEVLLRCIDFEFAAQMREREREELRCLPPLFNT